MDTIMDYQSTLRPLNIDAHGHTIQEVGEDVVHMFRMVFAEDLEFFKQAAPWDVFDEALLCILFPFCRRLTLMHVSLRVRGLMLRIQSDCQTLAHTCLHAPESMHIYL